MVECSKMDLQIQLTVNDGLLQTKTRVRDSLQTKIPIVVLQRVELCSLLNSTSIQVRKPAQTVKSFSAVNCNALETRNSLYRARRSSSTISTNSNQYTMTVKQTRDSYPALRSVSAETKTSLKQVEPVPNVNIGSLETRAKTNKSRESYPVLRSTGTGTSLETNVLTHQAKESFPVFNSTTLESRLQDRMQSLSSLNNNVETRIATKRKESFPGVGNNCSESIITRQKARELSPQNKVPRVLLQRIELFPNRDASLETRSTYISKSAKPSSASKNSLVGMRIGLGLPSVALHRIEELYPALNNNDSVNGDNGETFDCRIFNKQCHLACNICKKLSKQKYKNCSGFKNNVVGISNRSGFCTEVHSSDRILPHKVCCKYCNSGEKCSTQKYYVSSDGKSFRCDICNENFTQRSHLRDHDFNHIGVCPLKCDSCKESFALNLNLESNLKDREFAYSNEHPFKCKLCKKSFKRKHDLKLHTKSYSGKCLFKCKRMQIYTKESEFNKGKHIHSGNYSDYHTEKCEISITDSYIFGMYWNNGQKDVFRNGNRSGKRPYKCEMCDKSFTRRYILANHIQLHFGRIYPCKICKKEYYWKSSLTRHSITHSGQCTFKCSNCSKHFTRKDNFESHVLVHSRKSKNEVNNMKSVNRKNNNSCKCRIRRQSLVKKDKSKSLHCSSKEHVDHFRKSQKYEMCRQNNYRSKIGLRKLNSCHYPFKCIKCHNFVRK